MKKLLFLFVVLFMVGCTDDEGTPIWRIWYAVQVTPNYDVDIQYYSDKYHDSGILETINVTDENYDQQLDGFWVGQHLQNNKEAGYFINLKVNDMDQFSGKIGVFVYVNDTNLIDSTFYSYGTTEVQLSGDIPKTF